MVDATPSATPIPAQPVATETTLEVLPPLPAPLPHAVAPAVTDPVPNLDFPPVDDAFALEMRAQTIEQLAGGDALRRGESDRIEAGRSATNADLVAGRDRVRVQGTLREHTGHGLAEQAARLHTTVEGILDVHAASEDTVLLAGHMRDRWDGGAAIVAAMADDTVAGGGIRVTTPLDLWVHGLMGVEERIGTCTADAVLMELGATHYEREYGPGAHAAGLAVYTGSLYQSSRSTFRPLMRMSCGVRNLIAGGGGEGEGGGSAPAASPPPVPAQTGAAEESATGTLAAGRRAAAAPATTLDTADALTDGRRVPLEELVSSVDARASEETGEAGIVVRAEDLPELTRCADTAEQLGALLETLRIDATEAGSETAGGFRASELDGAGSMHPASGAGRTLEIDAPSGVYGANARMVRPHPGNPRGEGSETELGLPGGADRPPQPATPESDFPAVYGRLRELRTHYHLSRTDITREFKAAIDRVSLRVMRLFKHFGGKLDELPVGILNVTQVDHAYLAVQETARRAELDGDLMRAGAIRGALDAIDQYAVEALQALCQKYGIAEAPSTQVIQRPPVTAGPTAAVAAIPPPTRAPLQFDWGSAYRQLRYLSSHPSNTGRDVASLDFYRNAARISNHVMRRFRSFGAGSRYLIVSFGDATIAEQAYRAIEDMSRRATESGGATRAYPFRKALEVINRITSEALDELTTRYGALDALSPQDTRAMRRPPPRVGPTTSAALPVTVRPPARVAPTTASPPGRLDIPVPAHPIVLEVTSAFPEPAGGLVQPTGVPGPPPASGLPGPSRAEAADTQAGGLWRGWLDPPATTVGTTAAEPLAIETTVTPSLGGTSSFWLQPVDPTPAPGTVAFDSGLHHAGLAVRPPPVTTTGSSTAPVLSRGAAFPTPSTVDDDFAVERAFLAGRLPPGFDASPLIAQAGAFEPFGLVEELAAGRLPILTIDLLMDGYRATDEGGGNAPTIEYLRSLKESIERALRAAYPGRVDLEWLDQMRAFALPRRRDEPAPPSAASVTGLPEFAVTEIARLPGTREGASHPAPLPPPSAAGHTGAGAGAPPPAADPWRIRPPGMGGEPHPADFDPWSAPPGPSSRVVHTEAMRTPVLPTGAPPGRQGAETPGFARAASDAVELPFSHREAIVLRFSTEDALLDAELTVQLGGADALGWSATRWRPVLADLSRLNAIARVDLAAAAAMADIDWRAIETLGRILDGPPPSP